MSNIDKQALRERYSLQPVPKCHICDAVMTIARASAGAVVYACSGCTYDDNGAHYAPGRSLGDDHYSASRVTIFESGDSDVLELLDELEAKDKSIGFLKDQLAQLANFNPDWDKLEAATDSLREHMAKLSSAEKRIAELEAREVKLPNPHAHLIWIQAGHAPDDYWDDVAVSHSEKDKCCDGSDRYPVYTLWEIKEALSAIGINVAAAGKGE